MTWTNTRYVFRAEAELRVKRYTLFPCSLMPEPGRSACKHSANQQHSSHSHTHRMESLHTKMCHMKSWQCKHRYMHRCVCVWSCVMWDHDRHPDVREVPINIHAENVKHMKLLICVSLLTLINHSIHLCFSFHFKKDLAQHYSFFLEANQILFFFF